MFARLRKCIKAAVLIIVGVSSTMDSAFAVTADIAKKCQVLTAKAYPPREPGNPAAGSDKGSAQVQRDYFSKCLANGGNVDEGAPKDSK
jgi:hypothetical protein